MSTMIEGALASTKSSGLDDSVVAEIVGADSRSVKRWRAGDVEPRATSGKTLLALAHVAELAANVFEPEDVNWWMFTPNVELDHQTPADLIRQGRYLEVVGLLEALAEGVLL